VHAEGRRVNVKLDPRTLRPTPWSDDARAACATLLAVPGEEAALLAVPGEEAALLAVPGEEAAQQG
jgi:hypothetical protein